MVLPIYGHQLATGVVKMLYFPVAMPYLQLSSDLPVPKALKASLLTDNLGLPRYWATIWSVLFAQALAPSTQVKRLRYIEALYAFCDDRHGSGYLDDALSACRVDDVGNSLEAYFIALKNRPELTEAAQKQWQAGLSFVKDVLLRLGKNGKPLAKLADIEARLLHLDALYGQLHIMKAKQPDMLRSLPASVVSYLYEVLDPESNQNPFARSRTRWTVFLAFILMLHQGLRRGELLLLPVNAVKSGFDERQQRQRYWMNIEESENHAEQDPRYNRPGIKTVDSIRQVPVNALTANLVQAYEENYRGKPNHPFLLNTQWDTPLSHDSLTAYFAKISAKILPSVLKTLRDRTGKVSIDPHDLRHTCAVVRLNQLLSKGVSMDEALQQLRTFFGWSRTSDMPNRYARAVFEDRLADVWSQVMDDRIEILKAIPPGH